MATTIKWVLDCNGKTLLGRCNTRFTPPPDQVSAQPEQVRALAVAAGWTCAPPSFGARCGIDFCPPCSPAGGAR